MPWVVTVEVAPGGRPSAESRGNTPTTKSGSAAVGPREWVGSVLSYIVRGRSREIGIRSALGVRTADVLRMVIVEGISPALVGIAARTIAALGVGERPGNARRWRERI